MSAQKIPLTTSPNQQFQVTLNINGAVVKLKLFISFNPFAGYWIMQINDSANNPILTNVPLLTGTYPAANILKQYEYLSIGEAYILNVSNGTTANDYPTDTDLGTDFILLWTNNS